MEGSFLNTFELTDIATGWIEFLPMLRKGDAEVIASLKELQSCMPLPLLGLDTDNGVEFINHALLDFCEKSITKLVERKILSESFSNS